MRRRLLLLVATLAGVAGLSLAPKALAAAAGDPAGTVVAALPAPTAPAALPGSLVRWVSTSGSDRVGLGTSARPWRTLQHAVDAAPDGGLVRVRPGRYAGFSATHPIRVVGLSRTRVVLVPAPGRPDVVSLAAPNSVLDNLTVAGCRPDPDPVGGIDDHAPAGVRVDHADGTVLTGITVRDSSTPVDGAAGGQRLGCHGAFLVDSDHVTVTGSRFVHNGSGVFVRRGGAGDLITNNLIADNDAMIRDTRRPDNDDFGAIGIGFDGVQATGPAGPVASGNHLVRNRAASYDYGTDGSGFEIFDSSHVTMRANLVDDNDVVMETGTAPDRGACEGNVFSGNVTHGRPDTAAGTALSRGLILRCADDMQIVGNTIDDADWWAFVVAGTDSFSAGTAGLQITGNVVNQRWDQVFASSDGTAGWGASISDNTYTYPCGRTYRFASWGSSSGTFTDWRSATGFDRAPSSGTCVGS